MALRASLLLLAICLLAASPAWGRTWTNRDGRTVDGDFVRIDGEQVVLTVNGKESRVPLTNLSDGDQAYARLFNPTTEPPAPEPTPAGGAPANGSPGLVPPLKDPSVPDLSKSRKWTDRAGRSASGVLNSVSSGKVYLKVGSRLQTVDYSQLIDEDQDAVRRYLEYQGQGLQVPAGSKDLPEQDMRSWRDKSDKSVLGILRRVEPGGGVVVQFATRTATLPLENFSPADQEFIREQVAALGQGDVLPKDDSIRTWRDWRGRQFTGKLDPLCPVRSIGSTVNIKLTSGQRKSLPFVALSEADRDYLRQLVEAQGGTSLPDSFREPDTEIRLWSMNDGDSTIEGKFVRVAGTNVVLRTESQANRQCALASLSPADRRYIEQLLQSRGEAVEVPLVAADCRKWVYGPAGRGNTLTAKFGDAAEGYVKLLLPSEHRIGRDRGYAVLPYLCLSETDQEHVKTEWTGDPAALVPPDDTVTLDIRDWSLDEDRRAIRGKLQYLTHDSITVSEGGVPRKTPFSSLSGEDMDYVQRVVALHGMAKFDPPAAPAGIVYSGVTAAENSGSSPSGTSTSQPKPSIEMAKSVPMSAYEISVATGYSLGFVLLLVVIATILMKVLN